MISREVEKKIEKKEKEARKSTKDLEKKGFFPGGTKKQFNTGRLRSEVRSLTFYIRPLTFYMPLLAEKTPFAYLTSTIGTPFVYLPLENSTPFTNLLNNAHLVNESLEQSSCHFDAASGAY